MCWKQEVLNVKRSDCGRIIMLEDVDSIIWVKTSKPVNLESLYPSDLCEQDFIDNYESSTKDDWSFLLEGLGH